MIEYAGNCSSVIDWSSVIKDLEHAAPGYIGPSHKRGDCIPGLDNILDMWERAGYKTVKDGGTVAWDMFFPGTHFDKQIVDKFLEFVGIESARSVWISRVWPGRYAPWHWDVQDDEADLKGKEFIRFHCHISKPQFGHIIIVDDKCLYNQEQGDVYKWSDRKLWHAGTNCGLQPKYIFNLW